MDYGDELVSKIAIQYADLTAALKELRDIRRSKEGAVINYVFENYDRAYKALLFLKSAPDAVKERLGLKTLEIELIDLGNTPLKF